MNTQISGLALTNASAIDRNSTDYYPTPANVTIALLRHLGLTDARIWEPACGAGHMAEAIASCGHSVIASELYGQGYGAEGVDFMTSPLPDCDWIITNPPFKYAEQFIDRCIGHGKPFALLLKSQYWHSSRRRALFERHRPSVILPLTWRPDFHFGAKGGSPTMECAWTVWGAEPAARCGYIPLPKPTAETAPVAKQDNEDLKRAWQAGHDTAWYGKNPAHERGSVPVDKQVVMPEALDRAFITGESCDGVYRVVIQSETLKEMQSVHNWIVRLNAADHLAAMAAASAYDEENERVLFEAAMTAEGFDVHLEPDFAGVYIGPVVHTMWQGWKRCAKARTKAFTTYENK